ncbi:MAG: hypothetical protein Q9205_000461 [Flavoplaca limonia]
MGKRKRAAEGNGLGSKVPSNDIPHAVKKARQGDRGPVALQIIAGTYERVLHGISAIIPYHPDGEDNMDLGVDFADTFLFNAHASAIRCLALSPAGKSDKVILASGSSDQTINVYHISASRPSPNNGRGKSLPSLAGRNIVENPRNKELGCLQHHAASVNALKFPTRSKLLSAADDSTIGVARTRDWTVLSSIRVPIPKAHGRPSGDTAPLGGTPAGVNDFAIHPSMKLMVSVSKGERCMRLWNLLTGKKAGVLNFDKTLLQAVGEGRWGRGEGFKVEWNSQGEEFVVSFERAAVVFGLDSKPRGVVRTSPPSKIHQIHYVDLGVGEKGYANPLAISTEDGRVIFFAADSKRTLDPASQIPKCPAIGQIGGGIEYFGSRIKDFEYLTIQGRQSPVRTRLIVTGSSDGVIGVWTLDLLSNLRTLHASDQIVDAPNGVNGQKPDTMSEKIPAIGQLLGKYEIGNRITCLKAFSLVELDDDQDMSGPISRDHLERKDNTEVMDDGSSDSV